MDQLRRLEKRELICLLLFTCNYVVSVWRALRARLCTHTVFTKDQYFYIDYHEFSIKSYVLDVY